MSVYGKHAVRIFRNYAAPFIKTEHSCRISVPFASVPYFRLIYFFRKIVPYNCRKFYPDPDVNLIVFQFHIMFLTPFGKKSASESSYRKYNIFCFQMVFGSFVYHCYGSCIFVYSGNLRIDNYLTPCFKVVYEFFHRFKVTVRTQMLQLCLRHMQIMLQTFQFQFITRHKPFRRRSELHKYIVSLLYIIYNGIGFQKLRQPSSVLR